MAANKFATMLHRNTNKITLILVYAVLEWILIVLLLLNSLFSYLIVKFADYFGLKRPCIWCSRLDHIFEPQKRKNSHRDLICEAHAKEISKLGYCLNHQKLAESRDMCEDCSSSSSPDADCHELSKKFAFFRWMKQIGMIKDDGQETNEGGEEDNLKCSCCGVGVSTRFYPPCILIDPSFRVLDFAQKKDFIEEEEEGNIDAQTYEGDPPCILIDPSFRVLDFAQKKDFIEEEEEEEGNIDAQTYEGDHSDHSRSDFVADHHGDEEQGIEENGGIEMVFEVDEGSEERREDEEEEEEVKENDSFSQTTPLCREIEAGEDEELEKEEDEEEEEKPIEDDNLEISMNDQPCEQSKVEENISKDISSDTPLHHHLEFFIGQKDCTLIPVELAESAANENRNRKKYKVKDERRSSEQDVILDFDMNVKTQAAEITETWHSSGVMFELVSSSKSVGETKLEEVVESKDLSEGRSSFAFDAEERELETRQFLQLTVERATQTVSDDDEEGDNDDGQPVAGGESELDAHQESEDDIHMQNDEIDGEISIGTEIPDQEPIDEIETQGIQDVQQEVQDPSTSSVDLHINDNHDFERAEKVVEFMTSSVEIHQKEMNNHLALCSEIGDIEEDKVPDTPSSIDSLHQLHKKLLLLERIESGAEDSLDGSSVMSDIEGWDGIPAVEKLKSALKAERKALNTLYAELEEERSASAVAASQTMAMINRLQEEKAAMQMEALQYQRMMEEQSEYDQEALQLLNELMIKREREKQELEKELELYRKRVQEYEVKERLMVRTSSVSCSNAEDSDGLSIDLNNEAKEEDSADVSEEIGNQNTPPDAVLCLEESLASFEEERLSILDQLRMLEEKLFTLSEGDQDQHFQDIKSIEHLCKENGNGYHEDLGVMNGEANGIVTNGHYKEMNGKHHHQERRIMGAKAKRLLPFFDATEVEAEDGVLNGNGEAGFDYVLMQNSSVIEFEHDSKRLAVEEEVDHVYERLQALEADREFLKHCISSLKKGDKGLYLLQEILQHLRDLRSVEHRVRNVGDYSL